MLKFNPKDRISAKDALKHKHFSGLKPRKKSRSPSKTKIKIKNKSKKEKDPNSMVIFEDGDEVDDKQQDVKDKDDDKVIEKNENDIPDILPLLKTPITGKFILLSDSSIEKRQKARVPSSAKAIKLMRLPKSSIQNKFTSTNAELDLPPLDPNHGNEIVEFGYNLINL